MIRQQDARLDVPLADQFMWDTLDISAKLDLTMKQDAKYNVYPHLCLSGLLSL